MSVIRRDVVKAAVNRSLALMDYNIYNDFHEQYEFRKQTILSDESLTEDEKTEAIRRITKTYDRMKVRYNEGTKEFVKIVTKNVWLHYIVNIVSEII